MFIFDRYAAQWRTLRNIRICDVWEFALVSNNTVHEHHFRTVDQGGGNPAPVLNKISREKVINIIISHQLSRSSPTEQPGEGAAPLSYILYTGYKPFCGILLFSC